MAHFETELVRTAILQPLCETERRGVHGSSFAAAVSRVRWIKNICSVVERPADVLTSEDSANLKTHA